MKDEQGPDIVVIGASAGGVAALQEVVSALPPDLDAAVFVVLHLLAGAESLLPQILSRNGRLPASHPSDGQLFETGRIYAAPPDRHILLHNSRLRVVRGPKENLHRPAIDVLFRSAARVGGPRVLGVLLTATVFVRNLYCRFLCPVGGTLGLISTATTFLPIKRWAECKTCKICEKTCEWGAIRGPKIVKSECVRCDDCERLYDDQQKCVHWIVIHRKAAKAAAIPPSSPIPSPSPAPLG
jgi:NAD-dependent dihydropyrimidine dehydrogenase PreA subunit